MNEASFYRLSYGLYVISAQNDTQRSACVVNTLQQVTSQPPCVSVTINKSGYTCELVAKAGRFAAVALDTRADLPLIGRFGFRTGRDIDKFEDIPFAADGAGVPYPLQAVCARFSCKVTQQIDLGTHMMFIAQVEEAEPMSENEPLTYLYYRNVIKGGTPPNAPSYQKPKE